MTVLLVMMALALLIFFSKKYLYSIIITLTLSIIPWAAAQNSLLATNHSLLLSDYISLYAWLIDSNGKYLLIRNIEVIKIGRMVTTRNDIMNVLEVAVNTSGEWRRQCEDCANLETCINSWTMPVSEENNDCLNAEELKQYLEKFSQFMYDRMKVCQGFQSN
jgi:hypothetical protein